jgi:hypothetical protein
MPGRSEFAEVLARYGCRIVGQRVVCNDCRQQWRLPHGFTPETQRYLAEHVASHQQSV